MDFEKEDHWLSLHPSLFCLLFTTRDRTSQLIPRSSKKHEQTNEVIESSIVIVEAHDILFLLADCLRGDKDATFTIGVMCGNLSVIIIC